MIWLRDSIQYATLTEANADIPLIGMSGIVVSPLFLIKTHLLNYNINISYTKTCFLGF